MHDIDRTQLEFSQETSPFQSEEFEFQEFETGAQHEELMSEQEEIQLAHELLAVTNEQELEQFLGNFIRKAVSTVGQVARSPIGQAIGGVLKSAARKALPMAGAALGGYFGGPLGAKIGTGFANMAGKAIGLEQEMMGEELEFEGARTFVRLAADTARQAAAATAAGADPRAAAQAAAVAAARRIAPGLLSAGSVGAQSALSNGMAARRGAGGGAGGRWVRQGRRIVLYGV